MANSKKAGIENIIGSFIVGAPIETEEDVKRLLLRDGFSSLVATAREYRDQALVAMRGAAA